MGTQGASDMAHAAKGSGPCLPRPQRQLQLTGERGIRLSDPGYPAEVAVISGMAKGIDGYAHTACIRAGGRTVAFLGGGVDICYPKEHDTLHRAIIENGAVVSEYPPGTKPYYRNFARRNYLISSWAQKILVVQAGEKSGALITARHALSANKMVLAVPDRISEKTSIGNNPSIN